MRQLILGQGPKQVIADEDKKIASEYGRSCRPAGRQEGDCCLACLFAYVLVFVFGCWLSLAKSTYRIPKPSLTLHPATAYNLAPPFALFPL